MEIISVTTICIKTMLAAEPKSRHRNELSARYGMGIPDERREQASDQPNNDSSDNPQRNVGSQTSPRLKQQCCNANRIYLRHIQSF
ncbi:hypothetical protein CIT26_09460 [Mesorhizobium temperatum]|uniref:Uncharacterized protein n=1 Tax=Mesorhizobium temperatum TaxID=241416 RepID=A0A271LQ20_9HYPH|nr:hypothetical protein CIT26_09460 [Mesorhizobium temperatum]